MKNAYFQYMYTWFDAQLDQKILDGLVSKVVVSDSKRVGTWIRQLNLSRSLPLSGILYYPEKILTMKKKVSVTSVVEFCGPESTGSRF